jgi:uncharacterized repeat protein (TIGR01451 family)
VFRGSIPTFPAGSTITITHTDTFAKPGNTCSQSGPRPRIDYSASISAVGVVDDDTSDDNATESTSAACAELTVNSTVSPSTINAGEAFEYRIAVTNSGPGRADDIRFTDPLVGTLEFRGADCTALTGAPVCGPVDHDPVSRTTSSVIPALEPGEAVVFSIRAAGGVSAGTFTNVAEVAAGADSAFYDPNAVSDSSRVNLQVVNSTSPVTVVTVIEGVDAGGLDAATTFTGTIACATQGSYSWSVTVQQGASTASSEPVHLYDGESCTASEGLPPAAPAGYTWSDGSPLDPAVFAVESSTPITVRLTKALIAVPVVAPGTGPVVPPETDPAVPPGTGPVPPATDPGVPSPPVVGADAAIPVTVSDPAGTGSPGGDGTTRAHDRGPSRFGLADTGPDTATTLLVGFLLTVVGAGTAFAVRRRRHP